MSLLTSGSYTKYKECPCFLLTTEFFKNTDWFSVPDISFEIIPYIYTVQGRQHRAGGGEKMETKEKKERVSKQKLLKHCHQGQKVTVLDILERLEFKSFSCRPVMAADNTFQCSMAPPLWNLFRRPSSKEKKT